MIVRFVGVLTLKQMDPPLPPVRSTARKFLGEQPYALMELNRTIVEYASHDHNEG